MPEYRFSYFKGQSKPSFGLSADDDKDAFDQMRDFVKKHNVVYAKNSMYGSKGGLEFRHIPDPAPAQPRYDLSSIPPLEA